MVSALFVERNGPYWNLPGVDPWDIERDARRYDGPNPVVAHPPCQLWTNMAGVNFRRYAGAHNRPGNDGGCFAAALDAVRTWGGVLEHPAGSWAWSTFGLKRPETRALSSGCGAGWSVPFGHSSALAPYWVCEVWQSAYGHKARKRTWLLYSGCWPPPDLRWERPSGTHQVGWFDRKKPTLGKKEASRTPVQFRDMLLSLARAASP